MEEAQFFNDLKEFVILSTDVKHKKVYVFGLDGDAQRDPFGQVCNIIPLADTVTKLTAFCWYCQDGTPAPFTVCTKPLPVDRVLIGNDDIYLSACREHYNVYKSVVTS